MLITVDEVTPAVDEMITLAATYQHFVIGHRRVALIMGLPYNVDGLVHHPSVSFYGGPVESGSVVTRMVRSRTHGAGP